MTTKDMIKNAPVANKLFHDMMEGSLSAEVKKALCELHSAWTGKKFEVPASKPKRQPKKQDSIFEESTAEKAEQD